MPTHIKSGGVWRQITNLFVKATSVWRDSGEIHIKDGGTWRLVHSSGMSATGGTVTTDGAATIHTFTSPGTFTVDSGESDIQLLMV